MSDPCNDYESSVAGTSYELISAMSALNMEPEPIKNSNGIYLSETDAMAKHAYSHLQAAFENNLRTQRILEGFCREVDRILSTCHEVECNLNDSPERILERLIKLRKKVDEQRKNIG